MSQELETRQAAELAAIEELEAQASEESRASLADERIKVPILSIVTGTTKSPPDGSKPGDFFNSVTGAVYGTSIELLTAVYNRGRTYAPKGADGRRSGEWYVAGPESIVPDSWPEEFRGRVFAELPEAEETFKRNVNDGVHPWAGGPPITTTYNFTGHVLTSQTGAEEPIPVRLSLSRTSAPAARTLITMLKAQRNLWAKAIKLSTQRKDGKEGPYYVVVTGSYGATPDLEQRRGALELHQAAQRVGLSEGEPPVEGSATEEPAAKQNGIKF